MDFKEIKSTKHYLYDNIDEYNAFNASSVVRHNWRHGAEGEWVYTDDGHICQILKKTTLKNKSTCIRTVCGTFVAQNRAREMLGENGIPENIYTFSGTNACKEDFNKRDRTAKEILFGKYVAKGCNPVLAYKRVYPDAKDDKYIKRRTNSLIKTRTIDKMLDERINELLKDKGASNDYIIERYKAIADSAESDTAKLKALDSLAKMSGLFDLKEKKSEQVTIWAGFTPEQLEEVKKHGKPELITHATREQEVEEDENS
jgi:hypothetical protein